MLTNTMLWFLLIAGVVLLFKLADVALVSVRTRRLAVPRGQVSLLTTEEAIQLQAAVVAATPADQRQAALRAVMRVSADDRVRATAQDS